MACNRRSSSLGFASVFCNLQANIYILNWTESIPFKPYGTIQVPIFLLGMLLLKLLGKEIVWIAHNKRSHVRDNLLSRLCMWISARCSSKIICHAREGVPLFGTKYATSKVSYIPHPAYSSDIYTPLPIQYNYIIWGAIDRRKHILEFVEFAKRRPFYADKRILICGRPQDSEYHALLKAACDGFCELRAEFISDATLIDLIRQSEQILFTYKEDNTLGSGALIYSLNFNKPIIGPRSGAFLDFPGIVQVFNSFEEIENLTVGGNDMSTLISEYIVSSTWKSFASQILDSSESSVKPA